MLLMLVAVSGTGKSSIAKTLIAQNDKLVLSVSHTTRAPRVGEIDGRHYHFVERDVFDGLVLSNGLVEWAEYVGNCYGTARQTIEDASRDGLDLLFDIEVQGAAQIKRVYPDAVSVFILPPSWLELRERLVRRGTDTTEMINRRLERGRLELDEAGGFDYIVVNDDLDTAVRQVEMIYHSKPYDDSVARLHLDSLIQESSSR